MKSGLIITIAIAAIVIIGLGFFIFNSGKSGTNNNPGSITPPVSGNANLPGSGGSSGTTSRTVNIDISGFKFSPSSITINKGDIVVWTNNDGTAHTVTSDSGSELGSSGLSNGATYSHTFAAAGTYAYHCSIHTMMKGTIVVQ